MVRRLFDYSFARFIIVGFSNAAVSLTIFAIAYQLFHSLYIRAGLAQALAFSAGIFWSYFWNRRWVFNVSSSARHDGLRFVIVQLVLLLVSSVAISLAVDRVGVPPFRAWFIVMVVVTILNYFLLKLIVFERSPPKRRRGNSA